ncbi:hypothetical protein [Sphingomonas sp.]|uniref:hypothetical protein n=1 Tax=Sphingomonas sp. TaxID=28214 RepID=UPI003B3B614A
MAMSCTAASHAQAAVQTVQHAPARPQTAAPPHLTSSIPGLVLTAIDVLPAAPASAANRDDCGHLLSSAKSPAARQVAAAGWAVTGEAQVGRYRAVSFIGKMQRGTSGSCLLENGNIGFFLGEKLVALAWAKPGASRSIAKIQQHGRSGARLWDGDFLSQPFADIQADDARSISVGEMAVQDTVCGGAAQVPNVYGVPIATARRLLARQGWKPVVHQRPKSEISYTIADLIDHGVTEVDDCSGTGFGFCRFDYAGPAGALGITTVGDGDRPVADYAVECRNKKKAA